MTIIDRLYASGGDEVILDTLSIDIGSQQFNLVQAYEDITLGGVTYTACAMDLALPERSTEGAQDLEFTLGNITGEGSAAVRTALENLTEATVTFRRFTSDDLTTPAETPYSMTLKSADWTNLQIKLTASFMNVLDTAWPRMRYVLSRFPGLRYL
ncbi:DUF1833 family protein [Serratia sp. M24T3]|uniref:DUF1833 family protein n=1 Tax=Serratia sp. M24T3 TaxID=932213 RepID=UPI00025BC0BA|nr:DUF1833 family protein [Serratia sp. M24T3]EIC82010.1 hypothetical protein SPM24T3_24079 [Serratia sp. M24T3]EIC82024.1 hypothetical protein SPM24T3_24012 [Serratia sp. M24T3]